MDVFALWRGEREFPKVVTILHSERGQRTLYCQLKFKHSFDMNFVVVGRAGRSANARTESRQLAPLCATQASKE